MKEGGSDSNRFLLIFLINQASIDKRQDDCDYFGDPSDNCHNEKWFIREIKLQLYEKFGLQQNFTFAFMDSFSQSGPNPNDEVQQLHWLEQTGKLWELANGRNETFDFKTIDDVLEENAACKKEIQRLHDIIEEEITALKDGVQANNDSITYLSSSVAANLVNIENNSDMISSVSAQADLTLQRVDQTEAAINVNSIAINDLEGTG